MTAEDAETALVPIKVRDEVIGVIDAHKPQGAGRWTADEIDVLETLTDQLGVALDSARLYQETQRRASRERLIGEVTARVRETLDVDAVLQTAIREVGEALGLAEVEVRMGSGQHPLRRRPPPQVALTPVAMMGRRWGDEHLDKPNTATGCLVPGRRRVYS